MAKSINPVISKQVKDAVYNKADLFEYLMRSRTDNGKFIDSLVSDPVVGGKLADFMSKSEIRTYIKDAILNRYSKDKTSESRPKNIVEVINKIIGINAVLLSRDSRLGLELYKCNDYSVDAYVVVIDGTYMKWETALKKALMFLPSIRSPSEKSPPKIYILLSVFAQNKLISQSEKDFVNSALTNYGIVLHVYGEK